MASPSAPASPARQTHSDAGVGFDLDLHAADQTNPHRTKLAQLADFAPGNTAGMVPTRQADGTYADATPPGSSGGAPVGSATPQAPSGVGAPGTASNSSREDHIHPTTTITAEEHGFAGWTVDPVAATTTLTLAAGTLLFARVKLIRSGPVSSVTVPISTAGSGLTGGWVGVYALDGTLLGSSADQSASWGSAGTKTVSLAAPTASIAAGTTILVALLATGTTGPAIRCAVAAPTLNLGLTSAMVYRAGTLTGQAGLPSPLVSTSTTSGTSLALLAVA